MGGAKCVQVEKPRGYGRNSRQELSNACVLLYTFSLVGVEDLAHDLGLEHGFVQPQLEVGGPAEHHPLNCDGSKGNVREKRMVESAPVSRVSVGQISQTPRESWQKVGGTDRTSRAQVCMGLARGKHGRGVGACREHC